MINYEGFQALFQMLKVKNVFKKNWFNGSHLSLPHLIIILL